MAEDNRKQNKLYARCTNKEFEIISEFAKERGYNLSLLIRVAVLDFIRRDEHGRD